MRYEANQNPDPAEWLALDEGERLHLVEEYHRRMRVQLPNPTVHAVAHCVVENQIAMGDELPVRRTLERLISEGLDRHEAIHAVGSVLMKHMYELMKHPATAPADQSVYFSELENLKAKNWREAV
jgi:Domain of unknown function (DUF1841)